MYRTCKTYQWRYEDAYDVGFKTIKPTNKASNKDSTKKEKLNTVKYKLYKQRFIEHIHECQCRICAPHEQDAIKMRATVALMLVDIAISLVVVSLLV